MWVRPEDCGCIESVFFFELKRRDSRGTDISTVIKRFSDNTDQLTPSNLSSASDWFVKPLYKLTHTGLREVHASGGAKTKPFLRVQLATMSRGEVGGDQRQPPDDWCRFLIVHRTKPVSCDQQLEVELQRLYVSSHERPSIKTDASTVHLSWRATKPADKGPEVSICQFDASQDQRDLWKCLDAAVHCEPLGGVIALLGPRFANRQGTEYLVSPANWGADDRWLWMMTECPPRVVDNCGDHLQQRDTPHAEPSDLFFEIAGRKACVGRYATVLIDTRTLDGDVICHLGQSQRPWATAPPTAGPSLQWSLLYGYVHRWLTESLVVAMTQRAVLYRLSSELLNRETRDNFAGFLQELFAFRRTFWWEHLHRHPTAVAFSQFQQYFRLPSLMAQLSSEVEDYYQQEQQKSGARLNDLVTLFAAITVGLGLLQVSSLRGFDAPYFAIALGGIAALLFAFVLVSWIRRRRRPPSPVDVHR